MKNIYAFESEADYFKHNGIIDKFSTRLVNYQEILVEEFELLEPPKAIVWTSTDLATSVFSNVPIPAYTNQDIIYISPDLEDWRNLFIRQLNGRENAKVENYYKNITDNHLFTILAHELTHHSDLFLDEFDDERADSIWFEEGMCDYLSRKLTLEEQEFTEMTEVEGELVKMFRDDIGNHSLDEFGSHSYQGDLTSIMFDYWRSYLSVKYLIEERAHGDIQQVFKEYHKWDEAGRKVPLTKYFGLSASF